MHELIRELTKTVLCDILTKKLINYSTSLKKDNESKGTTRHTFLKYNGDKACFLGNRSQFAGIIFCEILLWHFSEDQRWGHIYFFTIIFSEKQWITHKGRALKKDGPFHVSWDLSCAAVYDVCRLVVLVVRVRACIYRLSLEKTVRLAFFSTIDFPLNQYNLSKSE